MVRYKDSFTRLRSLKTEIEHLQHLLEKAKVKMQKDFEIWWAEQAAFNQVCESCAATNLGVFFSSSILSFFIPKLKPTYLYFLSLRTLYTKSVSSWRHAGLYLNVVEVARITGRSVDGGALKETVKNA